VVNKASLAQRVADPIDYAIMDEDLHATAGSGLHRAPEIRYRALSSADFDAVHALWERFDGVGISRGDDRQGFDAFLSRNQGLSRCATADGEVVAVVLAGHDGRRGYLYHLAVADVFQGRGLARKLVRMALDGLAANGIQKCHAVVFSENDTGRAFWQAAGWSLRSELSLYSMELK
jgi:ribosomal protein S18 acetylase RimI-like enzyme